VTVPAMETKGKYVLRDNRHAAAVFIATHQNAALRSRGTKDAAILVREDTLRNLRFRRYVVINPPD